MKQTNTNHTLQKGIDIGWLIWLGITGVIAAYTAGIFLLSGGTTPSLCIRAQTPATFAQTFGCTGLVWLTFGTALALLKQPTLRAQHCMTIICSAALLILYINFMREQFHTWDVLAYAKGAVNLYNHEPFHNHYMYPPLLATLCQPFLWLGISSDALAVGLWYLNGAGLVLFFLQLTKILKAYGFGDRIALYAPFLFLLFNAPTLRTLLFGQVNFYVITLILIAYSTYSRNKLLSAIALAFAVHLKASPIILVLPFLYVCDIKWIAYFATSMLVLFALTFGFYGWAPFASFLANAETIYSANGIQLRDCSIDNVIRSVAKACGTDGTRWVLLFKLPLLIGIVLGSFYSIKQNPWKNRRDAIGTVLNSLPLLLFMMVFASPIVWEHHFIFLSLPFILLIKKMRTTPEWVMYGFAYLFIFLLPTFDFFPLSFCRLAGAGLLFYLCIKTSKYNPTHWFKALSNKCDRSIFCGDSPQCLNG